MKEVRKVSRPKVYDEYAEKWGEPCLSSGDAAFFLGISKSAIVQWDAEGLLKPDERIFNRRLYRLSSLNKCKDSMEKGRKL